MKCMCNITVIDDSMWPGRKLGVGSVDRRKKRQLLEEYRSSRNNFSSTALPESVAELPPLLTLCSPLLIRPSTLDDGTRFEIPGFPFAHLPSNII